MRDRSLTLVSVVLAVRDGEQWIEAQLEGLARQRASTPFEVIVADNGSKDRTRDIVNAFTSRIPSLAVVDASDRRGQRDAQRAGVRRSKGELLLFLDGDDVVPPGWVSAMSSTAIGCDMIAGAVEVETLNDGESLRGRPHVRTTGTSALAESLQAGPYAIGAAFGLWRDVWEAVDRPGTELPASCRGGGEDRDLSWSVRRQGYEIGFCPAPPLAYRLRPAGQPTRGQLRSYGIADAALVRRHRDLGARGDRPIAALRKYATILPRAAKARWEGDEAHWSRSELAVALGRLEGSLRFRVCCL